MRCIERVGKPRFQRRDLGHSAPGCVERACRKPRSQGETWGTRRRVAMFRGTLSPYFTGKPRFQRSLGPTNPTHDAETVTPGNLP